MSAVGSTRDLKEALNEIQIWSASPSGADARSKTEYEGGRRAMMATYQRRFTLLWNRPRSPTAPKSHCSCWAVSSASPGLDRQDALVRDVLRKSIQRAWRGDNTPWQHCARR